MYANAMQTLITNQEVVKVDEKDDEATEGCGCSAPSGPGRAWVWLLPLLVRRELRGPGLSFGADISESPPSDPSIIHYTK